jgi:carbon-monoxide dehydrogenase medium subunit
MALAGGTDLFVKMKEQKVRAKYLVDLKALKELEGIQPDGDRGLRVGALTLLSAVIESPSIRKKFDILPQAALTIGGLQTRSRATLGGNLCQASPAADMLPPLLSLAAKVKVRGPEGERVLELADFFKGPGMTFLRPGEILTEILIPQLPPSASQVYLKHSVRKALDIAILGVAVVLTVDSRDGSVKDVKLALGSAAPTPMRAKAAEDILRGEKIDDLLIQKAARQASQEAEPMTDFRASAEYKREMIQVFVRRGIKIALEKKSGDGRGSIK